jgi:hypothetical protein
MSGELDLFPRLISSSVEPLWLFESTQQLEVRRHLSGDDLPRNWDLVRWFPIAVGG